MTQTPRSFDPGNPDDAITAQHVTTRQTRGR